MNLIVTMTLADIVALFFFSLFFLIWLLSYVIDRMKRGAK